MTKSLLERERLFSMNSVRVSCKVHWHARSGRLIGLAMSPAEWPEIHDLYETVGTSDSTSKASYVLQFLWRCLTSSFDIIGPYYTSETTLTSKIITVWLFETLEAFNLYGFQTSILVADGASSNLTTFKQLGGYTGPYQPSSHDHHINSFFINPFTGDRVYTMICATHAPGKYRYLYSDEPRI